MESSTRLDHVLFQLTPTRTRFRKAAIQSLFGLLPLNAHWFTKGTVLRFVRFVSTPEVLERFVTIEREIAQLENSIKSYDSSNGVGAESEGNSKDSTASFKSKVELNGSSDHAQEENSKERLHRVLETRKAVLRKEQAMVYARALAAGYQMDNLHDLLLFSDAFGASRLREACIHFKDLCKKKNEDRLWVDEIAAMQAIVQPDLSYLGTSGIILAGEDNDPSQGFMTTGKQSTDLSLSDSMTSPGSLDANQETQTPPTDAKAQMPNPWAQQFHPYLRNFQGPMYQQMPPYPGYGFNGMQVSPPYYPPNMPWPSDVNGSVDHESYDRRERKSSSKKKGKGSHARESEKEDHEEYTESNGSSSETDSSPERSHRKKHGKKSSRRVVIRNINYISSKRDGENDGSEADSSDEDGYVMVIPLSSSWRKQLVNGITDQDDENVSIKNKNGNKGNENWDALQQLLMRDESDTNRPEPHSMLAEEKYFERNSGAFKPEAEERTKNKPIATDAFLVTEKDAGNDDSTGKLSVQGFDLSESTHPVIKRGNNSEEFLFSQRNEEPESYMRMPLSDDVVQSSVIRSQTSDDWFVGRQLDEAANLGGSNNPRFIEGDYVRSSNDQDERKNRDVIDDSFMIQGRITDDHPESQLKTDISLVSDIVGATLSQNGTTVPQQKSEPIGYYEPDELIMVRDHDTVVEQTVPSLIPELEFENFISVNDPVKKSDLDACADPKLKSEKGSDNKKSGKASNKDPRSRTLGGPLRRAKPETTPRSTFGSKTTSSKSQLEKEEERRKRIEELEIRRQKRIAERSSGSGGNSVTSRKPQTGSKAVTTVPSSDKSKPKPILRSSTIDRLAAAKISPKAPSAEPKKLAPKVKGANVNGVSSKTSGADAKKMNNADKIKPSEKKAIIENVNGVSYPVSDVKVEKVTAKIDALTPAMEFPTMQEPNASHEVDDPKDIKELHVTSSIVNNDVKVVAQLNTSDEKVGNLLEDHPTNLDSVKEKNDKLSSESFSFPKVENISDDHDKSAPELSIHPLPESPPKHVGSASIVEEKSIKTEIISQGAAEISEIEESTPPPTNEKNVDSNLTRKKWDGAENSPKSTKGFRKLLMFGRKS
ncbi:COP1-interacting protein 7 [Bienertia sinuspersici]